MTEPRATNSKWTTTMLGTASLLLLLLVTGCGGDGQDSVSANASLGLAVKSLIVNQSALQLDGGGFNPDDSLPGFGDDVFTTAFPESLRPDASLEAIINLDQQIATAESTEAAYYVRIVWGRMRYTPNYGKAMDFSGSIIAKGAAIKVLRLIRFESDNGTDSVLRRESPSVVNFKSKTFAHHDGLLLKVIPLPGQGEPTLSITTKPYSASATLSDLDGVSKVVDIDNSGNQISLTVFRRDAKGCPEGFVRGIWAKQSQSGGVFGGAWVSRVGRLIGHVRGIWGVKQDGSPVFYGRYIASNGRFRGVLAGTYTANAKGDGGTYLGWILDSDKRIRGVLRGHYVSSDSSLGGGFFQGHWLRICDGSCEPSYLGVSVDATKCGDGKPEVEDACDANDAQIDDSCAAIAPAPVAGFCCSNQTVVQLSALSSACVGLSNADPTALVSQCRPSEVEPFVTLP